MLNEIRSMAECPPQAITLGYEHCIPPLRHIARILADRVGIAVNDVRPVCAVDRNRRQLWQERFALMKRPTVVVNRCAGSWTPNKDWPETSWAALLEELIREVAVVEIGFPAPSTTAPRSEFYLDLRGQTDLAELIALIAASDLHVGPISGPVHIAAAFNVPSVVIYGGYENPIGSMYPGNFNLANQPPCSPCWLRAPCPIGLVCLHAISVETVMDRVRQLLSDTRHIPADPSS